MSELPKGWTQVTFENLGQWGSGGTPKRTNKAYYDGAIPWLVIGDLNDGLVSESKSSITQLGIDNSSAKLLKAGALLIGMYGSIGKLGVAGVDCATNQAIASCVVDERIINKRYFFHFLLSRREHLLSLGKGGAQQNISQTVLKAYSANLAPINEQIRIANKLDSILAKVDKAQARLDKIPAILKRFRQSVLAAATSGELTKEWREGESDLSNLLVDYSDKIEIGRLDSWTQSKLREFDKKGKFPKDDKWKDKYSTKREHLTPEGRVVEWNYESLEYLADVIDPNPKHRNPKYFDEGFHFISTAQFDGYDEFDLSSCKFVGLDTIEEQKERCNFTSRSIAVSRKGTIGETRILELDFPFALLDSVCVVNVDKTISYRYLNYALRGEWVQKQIYAKTKGVALKQISVGAVRELIIPLPTYSEQCVIVEKLDSMLSKARKVETQYLEAKARLDRLTQSILAKAFRGELVPQDPTDEAADKLLERILAERELEKPRKKTTKKRVTKAKTVEKG
ncbi:restriction endonuclease subunit S [Vibrio splendidus]